MFLRLVADSFGRRPRHKLLIGAALALGMAVATAALSVSLDVGDRLAKEFRSLGANLLVTPQADTLPLEIGGVDYRPVNAGAYLPESDLPKLKTIFWHNNIVGFAPVLETQSEVSRFSINRHFGPKFRQHKPIGAHLETSVGLARFIDAFLRLAEAFLNADASGHWRPGGCLGVMASEAYRTT